MDIEKDNNENAIRPHNETKYTDQELIYAVKKCRKYIEVCEFLDINRGGASYQKLKRNILRLNIDTSHFDPYYDIKKRNRTVTVIDILVNDRKNNGRRESTTRLRKAMLKAGLNNKKCGILNCNQTNVWLGKELNLHIDHINGNPSDNRIDNLRFICPNCHTQTKTYAGRSKRGIMTSNTSNAEFKNNQVLKTDIFYCKTCLKPKKISRKEDKYCSPKCYHIASKSFKKETKIKWPSIEEILVNLKQTNYTQYSKVLGVSDNAIRKHLKNNGYNSKTLEKQLK